MSIKLRFSIGDTVRALTEKVITKMATCEQCCGKKFIPVFDGDKVIICKRCFGNGVYPKDFFDGYSWEYMGVIHKTEVKVEDNNLSFWHVTDRGRYFADDNMSFVSNKCIREHVVYLESLPSKIDQLKAWLSNWISKWRNGD
jgi:hypothetical protein